MNGTPAHTQTHDLTIEEVDAELYRIVAKNNLLEDSSLETERSLAAARITINDIITRLKAYPEETRRAILHHERDNKDTSIYLWVQQGWTVAKFNEYFAFKTALGNNSPTRLLNGLHYYSQLPQTEDYSTADQQTQQQVHALLTVGHKLGEEQYDRLSTALNGGPETFELPLEYVDPNHGSNKVAGDDLINLILEYPQRADQIADIIIERNTSDVALIRSIVTSSTPSLSNGTL